MIADRILVFFVSVDNIIETARRLVTNIHSDDYISNKLRVSVYFYINFIYIFIYLSQKKTKIEKLSKTHWMNRQEI